MKPLICSLAALALAVATSAGPAPYRFVSVAEYPARPQHFSQNPPINGHAQVVFMADSDQTPQGVAGLLLTPRPHPHPGPVITLVPAGFADARSRSINDAGHAVFIQGGVFLTDGRHTRQLVEPPDDEETSYYAPAINQRGTVAFAADLDKDGNSAIFLCPRAGEPFAVSDGASGPLNYHSPPALDGDDHVVFSAYAAATGSSDIYLFAGDAVAGLYAGGIAPCVSQRGLVAFTRFQGPPGASSVLRGDEHGSPPTLIADSTGPFTRALADAVNDRGQVAFRASLRTGGLAVCIGDGRATLRVIQTGDQVLGRTVSALSPASINDEGQVAVEAMFTDGTAAVLRADPR